MTSRRIFLKRLVFLCLIIATPSTLGCVDIRTGVAPQPFKTGKEISPPLGCSQLRRNDAQGDC